MNLEKIEKQLYSDKFFLAKKIITFMHHLAIK